VKARVPKCGTLPNLKVKESLKTRALRTEVASKPSTEPKNQHNNQPKQYYMIHVSAISGKITTQQSTNRQYKIWSFGVSKFGRFRIFGISAGFGNFDWFECGWCLWVVLV